MKDVFWVYRCSACGWVCSAEDEGNIGWAHGHAEKHTSWYSVADVERLDSYIDKLKVEVIEVEDGGSCG